MERIEQDFIVQNRWEQEAYLAGRRFQHQQDAEFIEIWGFIGKESPQIWKGFGLQGLQAFKEMKIE